MHWTKNDTSNNHESLEPGGLYYTIQVSPEFPGFGGTKRKRQSQGRQSWNIPLTQMEEN